MEIWWAKNSDERKWQQLPFEHMLSLNFYLNYELLIELCQNIVESSFLRHRPSNRYGCHGNHAAGSKPI